ncbi:MAG: DsbA family protein [Gaiellaceae bacterium]
MSRRSLVLVAVAAGLVLGGALVGAMVVTKGGSSKPSSAPEGSQRVAALLRGVRQVGTALGAARAPVTLVEFADPQCPYCGDWARDALPVLVRDYVRSGKVRIVFGGMHFLGPDSETALRTALSAAAQKRFWNVLELLFANQGIENTGWVTDSLLRSIGDAVPGLDTKKMLDGQHSTAVERQLAWADALARQAGVNSTPTFAVGRTGSTLRIVHVTSLDAAGLRPAIDAALSE